MNYAGKSAKITLASLLGLMMSNAYGINYHELEVYGHDTEGQGILEIENFSSYSNGTEKSFGTEIFRNTLELNYGVTDWLDIAYYLDMVNAPFADEADSADEQSRETRYNGSRIRGHARFYEKGELPVNLGFYVEFGLPKNSDTIYEIEFKPIFETEFGQFTYKLNPVFEFEMEKEQKQNANGEIEEEQELEFEQAYAMSLDYRFHHSFLPAVDLYGDFASEESRILIVMPNFTYGLGNGFAVGAGLGFGLTDASEKRLANAKIEYEF